MAILTPLGPGDARILGALYGLRVARAEGLLAGSVNSNFRLDLEDGGRVFLRVYEEQSRGTAAREAELLARLARRGVPTPEPLRREDGSFLAEHAGKPVALFPWVEGEPSCQRAVTKSRAARVGEALARVHEAAEGFPAEPSLRFGPEALLDRIERTRARPGLPSEVEAALARLGPLLEEESRRLRRTDALIHGDLFRDNVLWKPVAPAEVAALLDFESASKGSALFDLAVTLLSWCFGDALELPLVRAMLEGYAALRPLAPSDAEELLAEARFACLRFSTTRITDFELRPRGSGVYKDFRRFLARLEAVEGLGVSGFRGLLGG